MPNSFIARITPLASDARPEHPIVIPPPVGPGEPEPPLGIWGPTDPRPTHPIYLPIPPGIIGGDPPKPEHPIWLPVYPAHPIVIPPGAIQPDPPIPAHPIYLPPIIWGPDDPRPTHPIVIPPDALAPGVPTHPIVLPPPNPDPPNIWGGSNEPFPTHPIVLPPGNPGNPIPPVDPDASPEQPMAYPINLYAHVPGLGVVGPITIHYPGPLPGHPLPGP